MIQSMTAYAISENTVNHLTVATEIKTVNSKYLDVVIRLPHGYDFLKQNIKDIIIDNILRGRIEVKINIKNDSEDTAMFEVNEAMAKSYYKALTDLKNMLGLNSDVSLDLIASISGIIKSAEPEKHIEEEWEVIKESILHAINDLKKMREKEGQFLLLDFQKRLNYIEECVILIEKQSTGLLEFYKNRLTERILTLTKGVTEIDPDRIAQESAILADRSDISEEIVRAKSHIKQFRDILQGQESAGRKLNFLLQEFNREFNTMGSKSGNSDISHTIVSIKSELEKIREQVQNVE